jgi:hypothetical protein
MNIEEKIRKILIEETEQNTKKSYVIFVSGIESAMSHQGQTQSNHSILKINQVYKNS